ncbi:MAG: sigma-54 dependent transcriptional regulator [Syntrophobacteraceae bacterium]|nr:sigma-54 dependent transcriptional regulator [Syntrophobacteraceae bacterium]
MDERFEVLVVDDDPSIRKRCVQLLHKKGYSVKGANSGIAALSMVKAGQIALVIADVRMPGLNGIELLEKIKETSPATELIVITGYGTVESAVKAIKLGAYDYITKPFDMEKMLKVVENVSTQFSLKVEIELLKEKLNTRWDSCELVSISDKMLKVSKLVEKVAPIDCNVLIQGESGTGKSLIAQKIHRASPRSSKPFVVVDCASLSEALLESELFGYVKGAFTGAYADKQGFFKVADQGTIFLDEIAELPVPLQGKLLRMTQDHEIVPVGSTRPVKIDTRIIAATNRDLDELVRQGRFREDLFFRLNVVGIDVPPLRKRQEDIILLARFFLEKFKRKFQKLNLTPGPEVLTSIQSYEWPGNVRELENLMQYLVVVSEGPVINAESLPEKLVGIRGDRLDETVFSPEGDFNSVRKRYLDSFTRHYLASAIRQNEGNLSCTARQLKVRRSSLQRMIKRLGISDVEAD